MLRYGPLEDQLGDLWLPEAAHCPLVCLLHGGFWRMPYGREQMDEIARDLVSWDFAVWNLEYRRLGGGAATWVEVCGDAVQGISTLARLGAEGVDLDLDRVAVIGHSAGGHLALWAAAQRKPVRIRAVIAEAPITDLKLAYEMGIATDTIEKFLCGRPAEAHQACGNASPRELLPIGVPQFILHGANDKDVPLEMNRAYVKAAQHAGDEAELIELAGFDHMAFLDSASGAHAAARKIVVRMREQD